MKRTPIRNSGKPLKRTELARGPGPERKTAIQPKRRSASDYARIYGSRARVDRMKHRPCDGCGKQAADERPHDTHHIEGDGGTGYKAGWKYTVTLCAGPGGCHSLWHALGSTDAFDRENGTNLRATAATLAEELIP